jgi:HEAT repeat protein
LPQQVTKLRVFVASPGDVRQERDRLDRIVAKLNRTLGATDDVVLELVRWETHAWPGFGEDAQAVINDEIEPFDIFVGVLWQRIGTPTARSVSGTVEEFERAFARWRRHGRPHLMFYFSRAPISPERSSDVEQLASVHAFRELLEKNGALYWTYDGPDEFADLVEEHLYRTVRKMLRDVESPAAAPPVRTAAVEAPTASPPRVASAARPASTGAAASRETLLDALLSSDPVVGRPAARELAESGAEAIPAVVDRLEQLRTPTIFVVRDLLASFPDVSAPLMVERVRAADRDWYAATFVPDCFAPAHSPYCADALAAGLEGWYVDAVRKSIESLGFLGSLGWAWRILDVVRKANADLYEKYSGFGVEALARVVTLTRRRPAHSQEIETAFDYLEPMIELVGSRGWQSITYPRLVSIMGGCRAHHSDRLLGVWLKHDRWEFRDLAAYALGSMRLNRAIEPLAQRANDVGEDPRIRRQASFAIAAIGGPDAVDALEEMTLGDNELALSYGVVDARDDEQFARLCRRILASDTSEKCWVYRAVGVRRDERFGDLLVRGLTADETSVRGDAALALARLAGRDEVDRIVRSYGEATTSRERVLCCLALLTIAEPVPDDPALGEFRTTLAEESWMYRRPTRDDILSTLRTAGHGEAADAWEPIYEHVPAY